MSGRVFSTFVALLLSTGSAWSAERHWPLKDDLRETGGDCPFRERDGRKTTNDDSFYDLAPGMSFSARLKFDRLPSTGSGVAVLSKGDVDARGSFLLRLDSADEGNRLSFFVNFGGTPEPRVSTSGPIKTGVWHDVAAGWDGRDIWLTVNGETRRTARPGKPMGCAAPLTIGDFNGSIGDLRFRSGQAETSSAADDELSAALRLFCSVRFERPPTGETQILGKDREYLLRYDRAGNRAGAQDAFCFYVYLNGSWEPRVACPVAVETGRVYRVAASWDGLTARLQVDGRAAQQTRRGDAKPNVATKLSLPDARSSVRVESLRVDNRRYPLPELREVRSRELLPRVGAPLTLQTELANCGSVATNAVLVVRPEAGVRVKPSRVDLGDFAAGAVKPLVFAVEGATNLAFGADFTVLSGCERLMTVHRSVALMPTQDPDRSSWQPPVVPTKTRYLDAISGDDGADGLTPQTAWRSCARARGLVLGPGERLLLRRGSVFRDELVVTACGASANWAEIGAYGEGPRPTVRRSRNLSERCVHIVDPSYLVVRDLVVCDAGKGLDIACTRGGCRGILVERCLAHHIEGLYRRNSHGIPEWHDLAGAPGAGSTSGIGVAGSRFRDVTLRDCESYQCSSGFRANGGDVWLSRMYCHDNFCPNTSPHPYLTDTTRAWLVDSVFDASGWQASAGTMGIMLAYNDGLVIRGCHFLNQPDSKSHDEGGIDFEAAGANVLVDACTFRNNAGAAIEVLGLRTPQVRNVHIRGSRFDGDNVAKKLGPSEIYVWGGTTDRRVVCSNGLVEDNGFVLNPGAVFYTNCAAATRADWTLRGNRAFASRDELNRAMPLNDPPAVEAGEEIWTDARTVTLRGRATDDGLPRNRLTTTWEQLEGPGLVRFADAATTNAAATFPYAGDYRLLLKADDGQLWRNGRTAVHVLPTGSRVAKAWTFARNLDAEGWQALGLGTTKEHFRAEDTFWDSFAEPVNLVSGDYYTFALKNASAAELVSADGLNLELKPGVVDTFVVKMNNHTSAARLKLVVELDASTEARTFAVTPNDTADRVTAVPLPSAGTVRRLRLVFADDGRPVTGTCRVDYIWVGSLGSERRVTLAVNEDNDHYFHLERDRMTREALRDYVDQYAAGGKVSHIFWTTCGQPANYDSQVWEPVWKRLEDPAYMKWVKGNERALRWPENCKFLWEKGIDPYVVWIDRCRERGISPWISMRMNDVHFSTHARMQVCRSVKYWRDHPELGRHPEWDRFDPNHREWKYFAFDYTRPEVRAYSLAMAKEQLERFRPDGLELDWMRYVCHLPAGRERELAPVLTAFMRDVRALADDVGRRAGRRIRLGVRLPTRYAYVRDLGYDVETWAYEGLCDLFVVGNKDSVDYGCDVADWKRRLAPAEVIPGMDRVDCTHTERVYADYAGYRGWADAAAARGAEGYYLFNAIYLPPEVQEELWRNGLDASAVRRGPRRYVATYPDSAPDDIPEPSLCQLPRPLTQKIDLEIFAGHGRVEKSVDVVLAFDRPLEATAVRMTLNGVASEGSPVEERDFGKRYGDPKFAKIAHRWTFPCAALQPDRNRLEILPLPDSAATVRWAEVAVDLNRP